MLSLTHISTAPLPRVHLSTNRLTTESADKTVSRMHFFLKLAGVLLVAFAVSLSQWVSDATCDLADWCCNCKVCGCRRRRVACHYRSQESWWQRLWWRQRFKKHEERWFLSFLASCVSNNTSRSATGAPGLWLTQSLDLFAGSKGIFFESYKDYTDPNTYVISKW